MEKILVLDFGAQYASLIVRRLRSLGVYAEIAPSTTKNFKDVKGIILSGGPSSVHDKNAPKYNKKIFNLKIPILGICYGMQLMAHHLKGNVKQLKSKEFGKAKIKVLDKENLFKNLKDKETVWMSHGDSIEKVPKGFDIIAESENVPVAAMKKDNFYGIQFHAEVTHTKSGNQILENFVKICKINKNWQSKDYAKRAIKEIRQQVSKGHVLMAASGGVDSTVASVLLHKALGENVYYVFVDTGLVRKNEIKNVKKVFDKEGIQNLIIIKAKKEFLKNLKGLTEPEQKRKAISETFFKIFQEKSAILSKKYHIKFLGQGTIYPDRIETAQPSKQADKIKSHHNVLLPDWLHLELVEPLKDFYKDEVREIGKNLNINDKAILRHPFPGPGLGVRILGELTEKKINLYKEIDDIVEKIIRKSGWYNQLWMSFPVLVPVQEFKEISNKSIVKKSNELLKTILNENKIDYDKAEAILLPVKSVGVMGDARTYQNPLCLRITKSNKLVEINHHLLEKISNQLINQIRGINRIILDITEKPKGWKDLIVIRAITSTDAMTANWANLKLNLLTEMSAKIMKKGVQRVAYDVTQKPPGTMEWE